MVRSTFVKRYGCNKRFSAEHSRIGCLEGITRRANYPF